MDREVVRCTTRPGPELEGVERSVARPVAQFPVQPSRPRRRQWKKRPSPRLRRLRVFPARLFRLQDGAAVRLFELLARLRRPAAQMRPVVRHGASRADPSAGAARGGLHAGRAAAARAGPDRNADRTASRYSGRYGRKTAAAAAEAEAPDELWRI